MATFGLDIGTHSIKAVQLERRGAQFALLAAGITSAPKPGVASDSDADLAVVAEAVKKLISDTKIAAKTVNISLPEALTFTRLIELPSLTDQEVASAISWQAEPYVPIPITEASIDYQIVGRRAEQPNQPGTVQVLLVAAPKAVVAKYTRVATLAGLTLGNVETELLSLARALAPAQGTIMIADLGATSSSFGIVRNGQLMVSRSIATGGVALNRALTTALGISPAQAEEYKKTYGLSRELEGKIKTALAPVLTSLLDEMKKLTQFYKTELKSEDSVISVILSGGVSGMPELIPFVTENLSIETTLGDPFLKIIKDERITKSVEAYIPLYGTAVGLAQNI